MKVKHNHVYILEDENGDIVEELFTSRQEARDNKKVNDEGYNLKHKIVRYVREEIVR